MSVITRMRLMLGAGVGVLAAAVFALLLTPAQKPAAAEPTALPTGLQYVPTDAALFAHVEFAPLWKSPLGDAFRKLKVPVLDRTLKGLTTLYGLSLDDIATATIYLPALKEPQDMQRLGLILTTAKAYDRKIVITALEGSPGTKGGKFENKDNILRVTPKGNSGPSLYADLSDDRRLVFGLGLKDDPKADPKRADGPHSPLLKQAAGATLLAGVNFANLPDEIRRDEQNFPPQMRAFLPIAKAETVSLVGKLSGKELTLSVAVRSQTKQLAGEVEKSLDILRGLANIGLDEGEKEIKAAAKNGEDLKALLPLLKATREVVKAARVDVDDRITTATLTVPTDLPFGPFVELLAGGGGPGSSAENTNNLKQLGLSIHNYHDANNALCPSYLVDKKGKPTLSWRVMMLPYLEQNDLFKKFKLDEPWDSEHNLKVLKDHPMPKVFLMPGDKEEDKKTRYRVFTGNGAGWEPTGRLRFPADFPDGTSNTIAIVTAETAVPWTKPDELEFDPEKKLAPLLHFKGDKCMVSMFDGSVRALKKTISEQTLKHAIMRADGMVLGDDF